MKVTDRIGRRLKLRDLHILLATAECGSMAKAARELAVSQPVISKTIADLEHTLGVRLLDRDRHGVSPTHYGQALLRRSFAAFDELHGAIKDIEFLAEPATGEVRVGALAAMTAGLLPSVIDTIRAEHPRIAVHVKQMLTNPLVYEALKQRSVDFIIGRTIPRMHDEDLHVETLFHDPLSIVAGTNSRWARQRKLVLGDLVTEQWILPEPQTEVGDIVREIFRAQRLAVPSAAVICSSFDVLWPLLATGKYLAALPQSVLHFNAKRQSVVSLAIRLSVRPRPVGIVTLKGRTLSSATNLFLGHIRKLAKSVINKSNR